MVGVGRTYFKITGIRPMMIKKDAVSTPTRIIFVSVRGRSIDVRLYIYYRALYKCG